MSPLSGPVLAAAAVVASPALVAVVEGTMRFDVAAGRFAAALAVCWVLISLAVELALPSAEVMAAQARSGEDEAVSHTQRDPAEASGPRI